MSEISERLRPDSIDQDAVLLAELMIKNASELLFALIRSTLELMYFLNDEQLKCSKDIANIIHPSLDFSAF